MKDDKATSRQGDQATSNGAQHIHFIGIGGIGVSGIAHLALKKGAVVSGSDLRESAVTRRLKKEGAAVFIGHKAENIAGASLVVFSSAIRPDNPEMTAARASRIPTIRRAEFLSGLMADKTVITVTGAHGKTTTSSLAAKLLATAGLCPTVAVGGILREDGDNAKCGDSPFFVAEADESDGTFLCYAPTYSIITNIDHEHMDFYKTYDNLVRSFAAFVDQTKKGGCVFACYDDETLRGIVAGAKARSVTYGLAEGADFSARGLKLERGATFEAMRSGKSLGLFRLRLMGRHNVVNALAVIALGFELGIDIRKIRKALEEFQGVERRFQVKYEDPDIMIVDDYGHHPTEIAATLEAARLCGRRLVVVFQPHRYSRTQLLMDRFSRSFFAADYLIVTDIYAASEDPVEGVDGRSFAAKIERGEKDRPVKYVAKEEIIPYLTKILQPGDLVLFLGAGDVTRISDEFAGLRKK